MFGAVIFILVQIFLVRVQTCPTCLILEENNSSSNRQWVGEQTVKQTPHMCMVEHELHGSLLACDGFKNDAFHIGLEQYSLEYCGDLVLEKNKKCAYTLKDSPLEKDQKCTYLCRSQERQLELEFEIKPHDDHVLKEKSEIDEHVDVKGDLNSCQSMLLNLLSLLSEGLYMREVQKEYMQWCNGYGPKAPAEMLEWCSIYLWSNIYLEQGRWPQGPYIEDWLFFPSGGDGPKAQREVPVECLKVACVVEGVVLDVDDISKTSCHLLVLEKFTQLDSLIPCDESKRQQKPKGESEDKVCRYGDWCLIQ